MDVSVKSADYISYKETDSFSNIIEDYLAGEPSLKEFYACAPDIDGIRHAVAERKDFPCNRGLLVSELTRQYSEVEINEKLKSNIEALSGQNCFSVCTAHQPNIFTGHLYFVYKILHAIRLAESLNEKIPACRFVPVYYMGSEDADLQELGEINLSGKKYAWTTDQQGAVGRMKVDKSFTALLNEIEAQLSVEKYGKEIIGIVRQCYISGRTIEQATFDLVHRLFGGRGLIILLPDNAALKKEFSGVMEKELFGQFSQKLVAETVASFPKKYKVQAPGREINLFYLKDNIRERLEFSEDNFRVVNTSISFTTAEIKPELAQHPERFSPNVILRPVFQEMILPNIAFIGGGGEIAYWLELKKVFEAAGVPYPVLVLRNSFLIVNKKNLSGIQRLGFSPADFFKSEKTLVEEFVKRESSLTLQLDGEKAVLAGLYDKINSVASKIDPTLQLHVKSLAGKALEKIEVLEKKMLKAEKKKFEAAQRQIHNIKSFLFPGSILQERVENLMAFYAGSGKSFLEIVFEYSTALEQEFCILYGND